MQRSDGEIRGHQLSTGCYLRRATAILLTLSLALAVSASAQEPDNLPRIASGMTIGEDLARGWSLRRQEWSNPKDHGMLVASVPLPVRIGDQSLRMELRSGDCGKLDDWDDCFYGNERIELISAEADYIKKDSRDEYGWSIFLPSDWNPKDLTEIVLGEFDQEDAHPAFQFFYQSHGGGLQVKSRVDEKRGNVGKQIRTIIPEMELRGIWHDVRVDAYWRQKADGYFRVYVDGSQVYDFEGRTMSGRRVIFKIGIYRLKPPLEAPTLIVYYDDIWTN